MGIIEIDNVHVEGWRWGIPCSPLLTWLLGVHHHRRCYVAKCRNPLQWHRHSKLSPTPSRCLPPSLPPPALSPLVQKISSRPRGCLCYLALLPGIQSSASPLSLLPPTPQHAPAQPTQTEIPHSHKGHVKNRCRCRSLLHSAEALEELRLVKRFRDGVLANAGQGQDHGCDLRGGISPDDNARPHCSCSNTCILEA